MNKFIAVIFTILFSTNLIANQKQTETEEIKPFDELPKFEQFVHQNLSSKLDMLDIHHKFVLRQNETLLNFMEKLEDVKDENGEVKESELFDLIEKSNFPKVIEMAPSLEKMTSNSFVGHKVGSLLEIISKNETKSVIKWFDVLENEIISDIDNFEKTDLTLPQYRYIVGMYRSSRDFQSGLYQLLLLMNPNVFKKQ